MWESYPKLSKGRVPFLSTSIIPGTFPIFAYLSRIIIFLSYLYHPLDYIIWGQVWPFLFTVVSLEPDPIPDTCLLINECDIFQNRSTFGQIYAGITFPQHYEKHTEKTSNCFKVQMFCYFRSFLVFEKYDGTRYKCLHFTYHVVLLECVYVRVCVGP